MCMICSRIIASNQIWFVFFLCLFIRRGVLQLTITFFIDKGASLDVIFIAIFFRKAASQSLPHFVINRHIGSTNHKPQNSLRELIKSQSIFISLSTLFVASGICQSPFSFIYFAITIYWKNQSSFALLMNPCNTKVLKQFEWRFLERFIYL